MSKPKTGNKKNSKTIKVHTPYFALKSQNEIYYQMASIFKAGNHNEDTVAVTIFNKLLSANSSNISLENSF